MAWVGPNPPPRGRPNGGREYYLPEEFYLFDSKEVPPITAMRVTAECVAQWCDRFEIRSVTRSPGPAGPATTFPQRQGDLPQTESDRHHALQEIFDWLAETRGPLGLDLSLFSGTEPIFFLDGATYVLSLTPAQFSAVQDCWHRQGLPRDLYYPASQQKQAVEPVKWLGGVVRVMHCYTPRQWSARATQPQPSLSVPTDKERSNAFVEACKRFREAIQLRRWELGEPGNTTPGEEFKRLTALDRSVRDYLNAAQSLADPKST